MSEQNLVSIIMPAYNAEKFLCHSIESVMRQTYQNWELIIIDDCSSDRSIFIIEEYSNQDNRIKFFRNINNSGPALTRNNAINMAKGKFLAFLDSDDIWLPEKLENQVGVMIDNEYFFTYTNYRHISEDMSKTGRLITTPKNINYFQLLKNTSIITSSVVLNVDSIGKIQMKNTFYDDFACWLEIMSRGIKAYRINRDLVRYRIASSSVSRNKINSAMQVWNAYRNVEGIGVFMSMWYFIHYAINALIKYRKL